MTYIYGTFLVKIPFDGDGMDTGSTYIHTTSSIIYDQKLLFNISPSSFL